LPQADIYVYDNNSTNGTALVAAETGAIVRHEPFQGKGNVVRRMFSDVEAEIYVLVDGDDTYDAAVAPELIGLLLRRQLDMINVARVTSEGIAYRRGHRLGNKIITRMIALMFGNVFTDALSGYRVLSRRFVKSFPCLSEGFEIETELTVHALELQMKVAEVTATYRARPENSASKLNTMRDGARILRAILMFVKEERPLTFFSVMFIILAAVSVTLAFPIFVEYFRSGLVPRLPTAVLATGLMLLAFLSFVCGVVLDTVTLGRWEAKRLRFLGIPALEPMAAGRRHPRPPRPQCPPPGPINPPTMPPRPTSAEP
jgi:hypothetical protein